MAQWYLFATPWSIACQTCLSMNFLRQEYWSGEPFPFLRNLPDPVLLHCKEILYYLSHYFPLLPATKWFNLVQVYPIKTAQPLKKKKTDLILHRIVVITWNSGYCFFRLKKRKLGTKWQALGVKSGTKREKPRNTKIKYSQNSLSIISPNISHKKFATY